MGVIKDVQNLRIDAQPAAAKIGEVPRYTLPSMPARPSTNLNRGLTVKYPAKAHLRRVVDALQKPYKSKFIFLAGSSLISIGLSDESYEFHQESNFYYCTGSNEPDWFLLYAIEDHKLTVFVPSLITGRGVAYIGQSQTVEEVMARYDVDAAQYHDSLGSIISTIPAIFYSLRHEELVIALSTARRVKDDYEMKLMRKASRVSSLAHLTLAKGLGRGRYSSESEMDIDFRRTCAVRGAKNQAYAPIIGSGVHASMLHYSANDHIFGDAELVLIDAAGSVDGYRSDVTRTYPIHGKFSEMGKKLYALVLQMQKESIDMLMPGVSMLELQKHCHRLLSKKLVEWKWVNCDLERCEDFRLSEVFFMHGIGHQIGLDTHDVDLYTRPWKFMYTAELDPRYRGSVVTACTPPMSSPLTVGNVVTVEPGIYFNQYFLSLYYDDPEVGRYFNQSEIEKWVHLGGVRIEDCVVITDDGREVISPMKKEVDDIEALCSGASSL